MSRPPIGRLLAQLFAVARAPRVVTGATPDLQGDPTLVLSSFLSQAGTWTHPGLVPLGNGKADFDDPWESCGTQCWRFDGEDLAEGEVESVLREMGPSLAQLGVDLSVETIMDPYDDNSDGYDIVINDIPLEIYRSDPSNPRVPLSDDPWLDCSVRPVAVINRLLRNADSIYQLGILWPGGNDGLAILLPRDILEALGASGILGEGNFVIPA